MITDLVTSHACFFVTHKCVAGGGASTCISIYFNITDRNTLSCLHEVMTCTR